MLTRTGRQQPVNPSAPARPRTAVALDLGLHQAHRSLAGVPLEVVVQQPVPAARAGRLCPSRRRGASRCSVPRWTASSLGWPSASPPLSREVHHAPHPQALRRPGWQVRWRPPEPGLTSSSRPRSDDAPSPPRTRRSRNAGCGHARCPRPPGLSRTRRAARDHARRDPRRRRAAADHPQGPRRRRDGADPREPPRRRGHRRRVHLGRRSSRPTTRDALVSWSSTRTRCARMSTPTPPTSTATATVSTPSSTSTPRTRARRWLTRSRSSGLPPANTHAPRGRCRRRRAPREVSARFTELRQAARVERARLDAFFDFACFDHSFFVDLRRRTRQDLEVTGNAFWEVLRDGKGDLARLVYVPSYTVRLLPLDRGGGRGHRASTGFARELRHGAFATPDAPHVQVQSTECVYFKSFGDPRVVSRSTGRVFDDIAALKAAKPDDGPATELFHFAIHSPRFRLPACRAGGTLFPPSSVFAADGGSQLPLLREQVGAADGAPRVGRAHLRSIGAAHRALHRGEPQGQGQLPQDPHPRGRRRGHRRRRTREDRAAPTHGRPAAGRALSGVRRAQHRQGRQRLPSAAPCAASKDFNRATAESALRFAEDQVFQPERDEFDFPINRKLLADMGIRFWRFLLADAATRDPERMTEMVERLARVGVLTPEEGACLRATSSTASSGRSATTGPSAPSP